MPNMAIQGAATALQRKVPPTPLRWLHSRGLITGRSLDYGSGRQCWYGMNCYDPAWYPATISGKFDTITCNYVLNVVDKSAQRNILRRIYSLLKSGGNAYITVRRDLPLTGKMGRGTFQHYVILKVPSLRRTAGYEIYRMHKGRR